ncbi:HlyD family secretion protein [Agathobacter sp.]
MSKRVKSLDEIRESRLLFDKNPPAFGYILITVVAIFMTIAVVWSTKASKVYTIQAQGNVTNDESNYVMCSYTGEILDCSMKEGELVKAGDVLFTVKSTDYDLQQTQLEENRQSYVDQVSQYQLLIKSIKDDTNYFDEAKTEDGLYWSLYETYKSQIDQNKVDVSTYQAYGYTDEQIQAQLETNQGKIDEVYYSAIQSAEAKIEEANLQIASIDAQLAAVISGQDAYEVKATTSGVLHMLGNYKSGMVVQTTTTVATITPENSQRFLEAYVSTSDMARMHEGDSVQVVVDGLSQNVYGTISGTVSRIDSNVTTQESSDGSASQAFKVMIVLDQDYLLSREGDKVDITNGMTAVARIQYDKVTYFNYVLEKLGIKTRK